MKKVSLIITGKSGEVSGNNEHLQTMFSCNSLQLIFVKF